MMVMPLLIVVALWIGAMWLVNSMAEARGREPGTWLVLAFLLSPLVAIVALALVGVETLPDPTEHKAQQESAPALAPTAPPFVEPSPPEPAPAAAMQGVGAALANAAAPVLKICRECAAEVDATEADRTGECPNCGGVWS